MTENEAKIFIQNAMEQSKNVLAELMLIMPKVFAAKRKSLGEYYSNLENCKKEIQSCEVAIKALEEVQQYRTIGTPEECQKSVAVCKAMIDRKITPESMGEYMKFEDECVECGFTLKSLLEAREKQTAKKIEIFNGQASCPNCKYLFGEMDIIKNLRTWNMPHCKDCGQKLDWSDEE